MTKYTIYAIHCAATDRVYVGVTSQMLCMRLSQHRVLLRKGEHPSEEFQEDFVQHPESFEFVALGKFEGDLDEAREIERNWIRSFGTRVYNRKHLNYDRPKKPRPTTRNSTLHRLAEAVRQGLSNEQIAERLDTLPCVVEIVRNHPAREYL